MLNLFPLLLGPQAADPLAQLRIALASPAAIQAEVKSGGASGTLLVAPDGSVRIDTKTQTLVHNREGDWEIDRAEGIFDHLPPAGPLLGGRVGTGRLTTDAHALIVPLLMLHGKDDGLERVYRRQGQTYTANWGNVRVTLKFGGKDRTLSNVSFISPSGGEAWAISGFRTVPVNPARFAANVPVGYAEAFEPSPQMSLRIGSPLPEAFRSRAPQGGGAWLLAVLESGAEPSERARGWLGRIAAKVPNTIAEDLSPEDRRTLVAPDSPTYILVGAKGQVLGVWIGHDSREESRMEEEMLAAISEAGADE